MSNPVDLIDLEVSEPICFFTWQGEGWYQGRVSPLIRKKDQLSFEYFDDEAGEWEDTTAMTKQADGLYHFRHADEHRWAVLAETKTHVYLTGNFINEDGTQTEGWPSSLRHQS